MGNKSIFSLPSLPNELLTEITNYFGTGKEVMNFMLINKEIYDFIIDENGRIQNNYGCCCCNVWYKTSYNRCFKFEWNSHFVKRIMIDGVTDEGMKHLALSSQYIDLFDITCKLNVTNKGLEFLQKSNVYRLSICGCRDISDEGMKYLSPPIHTLNISFSHITDRGLSYLPKTIYKLDISSCIYITDRGMKHLSSTSIYVLYMINTAISFEGLKYLPKTIYALDARYCKRISMKKKELLAIYTSIHKLWL